MQKLSYKAAYNLIVSCNQNPLYRCLFDEQDSSRSIFDYLHYAEQLIIYKDEKGINKCTTVLLEYVENFNLDPTFNIETVKLLCAATRRTHAIYIHKNDFNALDIALENCNIVLASVLMDHGFKRWNTHHHFYRLLNEPFYANVMLPYFKLWNYDFDEYILDNDFANIHYEKYGCHRYVTLLMLTVIYNKKWLFENLLDVSDATMTSSIVINNTSTDSDDALTFALNHNNAWACKALVSLGWRTSKPELDMLVSNIVSNVYTYNDAHELVEFFTIKNCLENVFYSPPPMTPTYIRVGMAKIVSQYYKTGALEKLRAQRLQIKHLQAEIALQNAGPLPGAKFISMVNDYVAKKITLREFLELQLE